MIPPKAHLLFCRKHDWKGREYTSRSFKCQTQTENILFFATLLVVISFFYYSFKSHLMFSGVAVVNIIQRLRVQLTTFSYIEFFNVSWLCHANKYYK